MKNDRPKNFAILKQRIRASQKGRGSKGHKKKKKGEKGNE